MSPPALSGVAPLLEKSTNTLPPPVLAFLPKIVRKLILWPIYMWTLLFGGAMVMFCLLPLCMWAGALYFTFAQLRTLIFGASEAKYVEKANLSQKNLSGLEYFATVHRAPLAIAFVMPLSFSYQSWNALRNWYVQATSAAPELHANRVETIRTQFARWRNEGGKKKIATARPGWMRMSTKYSTYKKDCFLIHVDKMADILSLDKDAMTVTLEPMVTMGQITDTLLPLGLTLPMVPELDDLTVGGMVCGTGIESSSHVHGLFQNICVSLEVILVDGSVVTCSRSERSELFEAFFWSYGTLGMLVSATLKIVPSSKYVRLLYYPFQERSGFCELWRKESEKGVKMAANSTGNAGKSWNCPDFIEGLLYDKNRGVVMLGTLVGEIGSDGKRNPVNRWNQPYFYKHVEGILSSGQVGPIVEYIPLKHYYHRHSRSLFWETEQIVPCIHAPIFRWLLGWMLPMSHAILRITQTKAIIQLYQSMHVIQDMVIPAEKLEAGLDVFHQHFDIYPLWICPTLITKNRGLVQPQQGKGHELFVDIGAYGVPGSVLRGKGFDEFGTIRVVEDFVKSVNGYEMLYAECYMTREEFDSMFHRDLYDRLRKELGADKAFPDIYDKIVEPQRKKDLDVYLKRKS